MRSMRLVCGLIFVLLLVAGQADAKKRSASIAPGTYTDWNGDLDQVEIVQTFHLADYSRLVVADFDTADTPLPERDDNTYEPVKEVLGDVVTPLMEGLREELSGLAVERQGGGVAGEGALVLRGRVTQMDPGSRAARYWAGFGAGAARVTLEGELVDAASGKVLFRFTQERRSGAGMGGGKYVKLMQRSLRAIGEDLGAGFMRF
jgi:hypothetical protein